MKRKLIQKLQQIVDKLIDKNKRLEVREDIRQLKLNDNDYFIITMTNKYKHYEKIQQRDSN